MLAVNSIANVFIDPAQDGREGQSTVNALAQAAEHWRGWHKAGIALAPYWRRRLGTGMGVA